MDALLFSQFRVTNLKLINEYYSFKMTWTASFYYVFLCLACFVVSTYDVIFIWVCRILMAYTSSTTYLFTRLKKTCSSCKPKEEWQRPGLYNYNERQIELFHMKIKIENCGEINRALVNVFVKCLRLVLVYRLSCNNKSLIISLIITWEHRNNNNKKKVYHKSNIFNVAYHQRILIVLFFNSKLNDCVE